MNPLNPAIRIYDHKGIQLFSCVSRNCKSKVTAELKITIAYSFKHAHDLGWLFTNDSDICEPGKELAPLCPECAKEYFKIGDN